MLWGPRSFTRCVALLIVAGTYGLGLMDGKEVIIKPTGLMDVIMGEQVAKVFWLLLAIAAFPPACFSSLIAAASFKNTLPKVKSVHLVWDWYSSFDRSCAFWLCW